MSEYYLINIWINEDRYEKLKAVGLNDIAEDVLAQIKVIKLFCTARQKDSLLKRYPMAKFDSATTKSIELLPPEVKSKMLNVVIQKKSVDIIGEFLKLYE